MGGRGKRLDLGLSICIHVQDCRVTAGCSSCTTQDERCGLRCARCNEFAVLPSSWREARGVQHRVADVIAGPSPTARDEDCWRFFASGDGFVIWAKCSRVASPDGPVQLFSQQIAMATIAGAPGPRFLSSQCIVPSLKMVVV